jgi:dihydroxyacetone kinase-like predicted kinase
VEFLLEGTDGAAGDLRRRLAGLGNSLAMVGGDGLYRVHVHTGRPEDVLAAGRAAGAVRDPAVASLADQVADCLGRAARGVQAGRAASALLAVAEESEVADVLRSLGAVIVDLSGDDAAVRRRIETAVASTAADGAVVLCSPPIADDVSRVLPTMSTDGHVVAAPNLAAAISAAAEYHPDASPAVNGAAMTAAAARCRSAEIPIAPAEVEAARTEATRLVAALVLQTPDAEVLTLVAGAVVLETDATTVVATIERRFPQLRVERLRGGPREPAYQFGLD